VIGQIEEYSKSNNELEFHGNYANRANGATGWILFTCRSNVTRTYVRTWRCCAKVVALQRQNSCDGKVISETGETNKSNNKSKAVLCNRPSKGKDNPNWATGWLVSLANSTWRCNSLRRLNVVSKWSRKAITGWLFSIYLKRVISSDFLNHRPCRKSAS